MHLEEILERLRRLSPEALAEPWDRVGLQVGDVADPKWHVRRAMLCIDLTEPVLAEAVKKKADMIVSYHPPIFDTLTSLTDKDWKQRIIVEAVRRRIAVYSPHTALDAAEHGLNDWLAAGLDPKAGTNTARCFRPIEPTVMDGSRQFKIVTFLPREAEKQLRRAMAQAGAGRIGNYDFCSYNVDGYGTFRPSPAALPTIGTAGHLEKVHELRMEMVCPAAALSLVIGALLSSHPYEEPAFDIYPMHAPTESSTTGAGRLLDFERPVTVNHLVERIKHRLGVQYLAVATPKKHRPIRHVGLCAGAGGALLAKAGYIDLFFTGEMRHHDILSAQSRGIAVILAGHTQTERPYLPVYRRRIAELTEDVHWWTSRADRPVTQFR